MSKLMWVEQRAGKRRCVLCHKPTGSMLPTCGTCESNAVMMDLEQRRQESVFRGRWRAAPVVNRRARRAGGAGT